MADRSNIEWTDATWTPIRARNRASGKVGWHCEHSTTGCHFCYAEKLNKRLGTGLPFKPGHRADIEIFLDQRMLLAPLRWKRTRMVFVCSMTDLFADFVPVEWIDQVFAVMALAPHHTFQVLTKRSARMRRYLNAGDLRGRIQAQMWLISERRTDHFHGGWPLRNVWLGVTTERQEEADQRISDLLGTPAATRFISAEPLLGPIDLMQTFSRWQDNPARVNAVPLGRQLLNWVIVGGESGTGARPMHPDWARTLRDQCAAAGIAFFFKQWGSWKVAIDRDHDDPDWRADYARKLADNGDTRWLNVAGGRGFHGERFHVMRRTSKLRAGRLLDGNTHNAMPEVRL